MWIVSQKTWETRVAAEERDCHGALDAGQSSARAGVETAPLPDLPGIHSIHRVPWAVCAGQTWGGGSPFSSKRESSRVILDHDPGQLLSSGSAALLSLRHTQRRQWDGIRCRSGLRGERLQLWHGLTQAVNFWYNMGTCLLPRGIGLGSWGLLMDTKLIYTLRLVSLRRRRRRRKKLKMACFLAPELQCRLKNYIFMQWVQLGPQTNAHTRYELFLNGTLVLYTCPQ